MYIVLSAWTVPPGEANETQVACRVDRLGDPPRDSSVKADEHGIDSIKLPKRVQNYFSAVKLFPADVSELCRDACRGICRRMVRSGGPASAMPNNVAAMSNNVAAMPISERVIKF